MRFLGNAALLLVALSIMVGLLFAQRDYQNSWSEPPMMQSSAITLANAGTPNSAGGSKVVMK
jgi:hypothetical protein